MLTLASICRVYHSPRVTANLSDFRWFFPAARQIIITLACIHVQQVHDNAILFKGNVSYYTTHPPLHTTHYTLSTTHYTPYTIHHTLHTLHYTPSTIHYTHYTLHTTHPPLYTIHCTTYPQLYTTHPPLHTTHPPLHTTHPPLCTTHYTPYTIHYTPHTQVASDIVESVGVEPEEDSSGRGHSTASLVHPHCQEGSCLLSLQQY